MQPTVLLFLKTPRPGFVKTRLAVDLGNEVACQVYRHLAEQTLAQVPADWPCHIYFAPADAEAEMSEWLGNQHHYYPQTEGDLGQRLSSASREAFESGASSIILLGGDCPDIRTHHLEEAAQHLEKKSAIIGPAADGGYWLLGLPRHCPEVFEKIQWSSSEVLPKTLETLAQLELPPAHLPILEDVDDLASWSRHPDLKKIAINPTPQPPKSL